MSITTSEMTPADIRACTCGNDGNGGMWGGDWLAYILLFAVLGGGFGGFGGFGGGGGILPWLLFGNGGFGGGRNCATTEDLAAGFNNSAVLSGINGIDSALCQGFNGINTALLQGFNGVERSFYDVSRQIADCCCGTQRAIDGVNYNMAKGFCDIGNVIQNTTRDVIDNQNANSRAILDFLVQSKLADKDARIAALEGQVARADQNAVLRAAIDASTAEIIRRTGNDCPQPAFLVNGPTPINFPVNACGQVQFGNNCNPGNGCNGF